MTIILHGMGSPNVRKVAIMLEELGLAYELRHIAVFAGEQFDPDFLALNPLAKVPVLEDPRLDLPLAESGAILLWLAEREGSALLPARQPARAEVLQWLMMQMASVGPMLGQLNHFRIVGEDREPYAHARYRQQAARLYRVLEDRLGGRMAPRPWLAGDDYSVADIAVWPWSTYLEGHGFDADAHPALVRWRDRIAARPAVIRAGERMDAAFTAASTATRTAASAADLDRFFGRTPDMPAADYSSIRH